MASHTVALDSEAYRALKSLKRADESFSSLVKRLARPWKPVGPTVAGFRSRSAKERREMDAVYGQIAEANRRRDEKLRRQWI